MTTLLGNMLKKDNKLRRQKVRQINWNVAEKTRFIKSQPYGE